jgi:GTP-binding protein EngB required for normal cell division
MSLSDYEAAKFELAEILRAGIALADKDREAVREQARDVFARLAEDRFNLLVVGRFSRGKSSLMNAVLGMDRLPTGVLPVTSVITSVEYANPEALHIEYQDNRFGFEVPMQNLAEYTTERGNPGNERGVQVARVGLSAEILRRGFFFVDSPGLGSAVTQNTRTTEAFLPEADALVMVSGYDGPLSEDEVRVLRLLSGAHLRLFFVLNKQDTISSAERQDVFDYLHGRLKGVWGGQGPRVFSLSALDGLAAKMAGDHRALEASGLEAFERELTRFLVEERGSEFLRGICDRVTRVLGTLSDLPEVQALRERAAMLRDKSSILKPDVIGTFDARLGGKSEPQTWGACDLCAEVHDRLFDFLTRYQYELATFPEAATRLAQAGGLCGPHLRLYASLAAERDICVALAPLLSRWTQWLAEEPAQVPAAAPASCRLCTLQEEVEDNMIAEWRSTASADPGKLEHRSFCLPHLQKVIERLEDRIVAPLVARHARALERLTEDMRRYVVKRDGTRNGLTTQEESRAAQKALALVAGARTFVVRTRSSH